MINGQRWNIAFVPPYHRSLEKSDKTFTVGVTDIDTHTIYINNQLYGSFLKKVSCHEITHAAMYAYNISMPINQEELFADIMATYGEEIINRVLFSGDRNYIQEQSCLYAYLLFLKLFFKTIDF